MTTDPLAPDSDETASQLPESLPELPVGLRLPRARNMELIVRATQDFKWEASTGQPFPPLHYRTWYARKMRGEGQALGTALILDNEVSAPYIGHNEEGVYYGGDGGWITETLLARNGFTAIAREIFLPGVLGPDETTSLVQHANPQLHH